MASECTDTRWADQRCLPTGRCKQLRAAIDAAHISLWNGGAPDTARLLACTVTHTRNIALLSTHTACAGDIENAAHLLSVTH